MKSWKKIDDTEIKVKFKKDCKCTGMPNKVDVDVSDLVYAGIPICSKCGDDYKLDSYYVKC